MKCHSEKVRNMEAREESLREIADALTRSPSFGKRVFAINARGADCLRFDRLTLLWPLAGDNPLFHGARLRRARAHGMRDGSACISLGHVQTPVAQKRDRGCMWAGNLERSMQSAAGEPEST